MKPGDIVLLRFPQADLAEGKLRPAEESIITARLGEISAQRLQRIKKHIVDWLGQ